MSDLVEEHDHLRRQVDGRDWYHTLELAPGIVTRGWFDTRPVASVVPLPRSLRGRRCLDVGTFDGFWAFEMERRGAEEVVAVDALEPTSWDWPERTQADDIAAFARRHDGGAGFTIAQRALGSSVERVDCNVYDLDPAALGTFDVVYVGSLLIHLRDPIRALGRIRRLCAPDGELILVDNVDLPLSVVMPRQPVARLEGVSRPWWWKANMSGIVRMVTSAGFEVTERPSWVFMPPGAAHPRPRTTARSLLTVRGREAALINWKGDPHGAVRARPAPA